MNLVDLYKPYVLDTTYPALTFYKLPRIRMFSPLEHLSEQIVVTMRYRDNLNAFYVIGHSRFTAEPGRGDLIEDKAVRERPANWAAYLEQKARMDRDRELDLQTIDD